MCKTKQQEPTLTCP